MQIDLNGKVAIVTGAGRGIGLFIARTLAAEGAYTVATDVSTDRLEIFAQALAENGWQGETAACDVRSLESIQKLVAQLEQTRGRIDILVNNAGILVTGYLDDVPEEKWDACFDINTKGVYLMCQGVAPVMKRQRYGRIINAASFAAIVPSAGSGAYAASKAAVVSMTRVLAGELGPYGITANCYAPGMVPTEMNHFADADPKLKTRLLDTLSLRRWGAETDVANLICFLASDLAGYITGSLIDVSGGKLATQVPRAAYEIAAQKGDYAFEE